MYSSMNLQAMYTGVISKYIQNSSLKVFEEVLVLKKKALFLQQTIKKEVSYLWRDSRLKVEGCFFFLLSSLHLKSWLHMKEREERSRAGDTVILTCHWRKSKDVPPYQTKPWPLTRDPTGQNVAW